MSQMDITQVQMVRSAKGVDMLCVDNFLYHFIDRGNKRCRWVCNKLKAKPQSCRSRIATVIVDGDDSKHKVVRVTNEHTHERCSEKEIYKVVERKRRADLAGQPCTLESKQFKRKQRLAEEEDENTSSERKVNEEAESDEWPGDDEELFPNQAKINNVGVSHNGNTSSYGGGQFFNFNKQKLYMLKTALGRQMICVDGFLYRLESKSITSSTHRWECIKQDPPCKVRILTEYLSNGTHRVKDRQLPSHRHDGYTPWKLAKLLLKNNITVLTENGNEDKDFQSIEALDSEDFEEVTCTTQSNKPPKKRTTESLNAQTQKSHSDTDALPKPKRFRTKSKAVTYTFSEDPLAALSTSIKTDLDKTKFTFLPSAKGHKVLCLDNYIYHLDSRSPRNGRAYWTCLLRRDKFYKCNARVTTEMTHKGPIVIRVSGTHLHSDHSQDIKRRLCRSFVVQNAEKAGLKTDNILNESGNELNEDFKQIVEKSKEAIERRIGPLRKRIHDDGDDQPLSKGSKTKDIDEDTVSSFSSALDSDDDHLDSTSVLPAKLEEMCEGAENSVDIKTKVLPGTSRQEDNFSSTYEDLVEEMIADDEMEVEYLDLNSYENEENAIEVVNATDEYFDTSQIYQKGLFSSNLVCDAEMNINNVSTLRSAKGGELLCVDGYIYHLKSTQNNRTYWACIKSKDAELNCKSRVSTFIVNNEIRVFRTTNHHTHPVIEADIKRRLYNEIRKEREKENAEQMSGTSIDAINVKYSKMLSKYTNDKVIIENVEAELEDAISMTMKLYAVSDGPPSLAVRMTLKILNIPYELISVDYVTAEHMTDEYAKMNPQKEIPVLDDDGFYLPESIAIMQYLCDKYAPDNKIYPKDATKRAIVNHRLCFNMGFYYAAISAHSMAPIFFDYQRTDMSLKKVRNALNVFETYLRTAETKYAAADHLTIADFGLVTATLCLEAIGFDLSPYPLVNKWYELFKAEYPALWEIADGGMQEIAEFEKNPPDLSLMNHPFHPTRKT